MRNLSLGFGSGYNASNQNVSSPTRPTLMGSSFGRQQVNEWETKWDEDDDDEEEEEDTEEIEHAAGEKLHHQHEFQQQQFHRQHHQAQYPAPPPPILDSGYASAASAVMPPTIPQHQLVYPSPARPSETHEQLQYATPPMETTGSKAHLVTATPGISPMTPQEQPRTDDEDGVEWDTGISPQKVADGQLDKPNVEQFLPLLRVLGKGSFGKVRFCHYYCLGFWSSPFC